MTRSLSNFAAANTVLLTMTACATAPRSDAGKLQLRISADKALAKAQHNDPSFAKTILDSAGYVVFPAASKDGSSAGASSARGALYEYGTFVGFCDLTQSPTDLQVGAPAVTEIIVFQTEEAVRDFKSGKLGVDGALAAQSPKSTSGTKVKYTNCVAAFVIDGAGQMYEASVGGQTFSYQPADRTTAVAEVDGLQD
jgi:hypothetical protein